MLVLCGSACGNDEELGALGLTLTELRPQAGSARGGDELTLLGSGFQPGATVTVGGEQASSVEVLSPERALVVTPPLVAGLLDVGLENPDGTGVLLAGGFEALALDLRFVEAPPIELELAEEAAITGAAAADFDGDGDLDLALGVSGGPSELVLNDGLGNFERATSGGAASPLPGWSYDTRAIVAADFDGDGDIDLFGANGGTEQDCLYLNDGSGQLEDVSASALVELGDESTAAASGDLDGDGDLDLVVGNATADDDLALRVYWNGGTGIVPTSSALAFELDEEGTVPARDWLVADVALGDLDGDGALDMVVAIDPAGGAGALRLLRWQAPSGFVETPASALPAPADPVGRVALGDVDGDEDLDVLASCGPGQDRLLVNDGSGHFFDDTVAAMPFDAAAGRWAVLADLDRDADLDAVIANHGAPSRLYLNDGGGRYRDYTPLLPLHADESVRALVLDADDDADQDIVLANGAGVPLRLYLSVKPSPYDDLP